MSNLSTVIRLRNVMRNQMETEEALAEAFSRLRPALTKRACAIIRNYDDVEDVVQESAARAWDARARLRPGSDPAPWLNTIVTRVAIDFVRKSRRRAEALSEEPRAQDPPAEDLLMQSEAVAAVSSAARHLANRQRRVLFMHDFMGFTAQEIAQLDEIPYQTVRTRLRRARESVRHHLQGGK